MFESIYVHIGDTLYEEHRILRLQVVHPETRTQRTFLAAQRLETELAMERLVQHRQGRPRS